jgi:hypothetical protein
LSSSSSRLATAATSGPTRKEAAGRGARGKGQRHCQGQVEGRCVHWWCLLKPEAACIRHNAQCTLMMGSWPSAIASVPHLTAGMWPASRCWGRPARCSRS